MTLISLDNPEHGLANGSGRKSKTVYLHRLELMDILQIYGRMVAAGEWRDYGVSFQDGYAVFSIHRRTSEMPIYRIIKEPALAKKQGMWRIMGSAGQVLRRGHNLQQLLKYFDKLALKTAH